VQPKPASHAATRSLPINVSTPVIRAITWITTHLSTWRDGRLSWPSWLADSGRFSRVYTKSGHACQPYFGHRSEKSVSQRPTF